MLDTERYCGGEDAEETHPIYKMKLYIKRNLAEELTLESLAELVHLHPQYVSRLFKQRTGLTLMDYIIQIRLEKAMPNLPPYQFQHSLF
ncbi:AraC family transcriptional regulator [Aneurinibacillus aneurinilyticus]|uniref:AraC family transcriptional regulator n=1 Tax=Aneurinibacillus aneurinilyticus TaxID=1391 RepID=UPI00366F81F0